MDGVASRRAARADSSSSTSSSKVDRGPSRAPDGSPALVASAALARGTVELARGKAEDALAHLRRARRIWTEIDLPFELARTRLLLSQAHSALGDRDETAMEERAALAIWSRIGAGRE